MKSSGAALQRSVATTKCLFKRIGRPEKIQLQNLQRALRRPCLSLSSDQVNPDHTGLRLVVGTNVN